MGALDHVADAIVHGARESFVRSLTNALVGALRALVGGTGSEARAANALDMASARVAEQAMGVWAEHRPMVTAQAAREVGRALRANDEALSRELVRATGADAPSGLTNRARNDLAQATRGVREVVGRQNVRYEATEAKAIAARAAATEAMQGATDAHVAAQAWYEVAGAAVTRADMGDDPDAVLSDAVAELARRGLETVDYRSGQRTTVDAAVRRHIDSQLSQAAIDMAVRQCDEWGVGLVMVDAHWGARPSHAAWQGKAYSLHGEVEVDGVTYPDLYEATGYQGRNGWPLGAQLAGVNCRHRIYPYVPGESVIPGTSEDEVAGYEQKYGMTSEEYYEATQRQRAMERELRAAKREAAFLEDEGLDATSQRYRIGVLQRKLREFCRQTGLERDPTRERAYGVSHQPRGLSPQSKAAQAKTLALKARMVDDFSDHFSGTYVTKARRSYASAKDVAASLRKRTGVDFDVDARWFDSLPKEQQRAIAVGIDYGMEIVGEPARRLLALRTYHSDADEYAMHQRREGGYLIDINLDKLASMTPDQLEQVMLHEVSHSAENGLTTWAEHERERDALLAWRSGKTKTLKKPTLSGIIERELAKAGYRGDTDWDESDGKMYLFGQAGEDAASISDYAVRHADEGTQDSELSAESIRYVANNGYGENGVADAIAKGVLRNDVHRRKGKGTEARG